MSSLETTVRHFKAKLGLISASPFVAAARPVYNLVLNTVYARRGLARVINGEEMIRVRPAHRYATEDYELSVFARLKRCVQPGAVILEVGAHVGLFTIVLARWAGPSGHIYAFEPAPRTRAALKDHLALNRVAGMVTVVPEAVSDAVGTAAFYLVSSSPENTLSQTHTRLPTAGAIEVPVTTIDAFCAARHIVPTLIKIDIEGFEFHALRGAIETLVRHRPVTVVEVHPMNWPEIGVCRDQAAALLAELGYRAIPLNGQT